jgi:CSLREA domain-containing protein
MGWTSLGKFSSGPFRRVLALTFVSSVLMSAPLLAQTALTRPIHDTGQTQCFEGGTPVACAPLPAGSRGALTITVNTLAGDDDGVCGTDGGDPIQDCSLLEAIALANSDPAANVVGFSVSGEIALSAGVVVTTPVTLDGTTAPGGAHAIRINASGVGSDAIVITGAGASDSEVRGLVVGQAPASGVAIDSSASNVRILGNYIGTNAAGDNLGNSAAGVLIRGGSSDNIVGGPAGNTIGFNGVGVVLEGAGTTANALLGNYIGTNAAGQNLGNTAFGVNVSDGASDNAVGEAGAGNTIGFNGLDGVLLQRAGTTANRLEGNFIGTNAAGQNLGNVRYGVISTEGVSGNTIGGAAPGAGNTIGFNGQDGIYIQGPDSTGNEVLGNYIGTNAAGQNLGNTAFGVTVTNGASANAVGEAGAGNTIGFNGLDGVLLQSAGTTANRLEGNFIGTNAAGQNLGNLRYGVFSTEGVSGNTIGGAAPGAGNTIGFNGQDGIYILGPDSTGNEVLGNYIGTNAAGDDLGNTGNGVLVSSGSTDNTIGGSAPGAGNTIGFNNGNGVFVAEAGTTGNHVLGNFIGTNAVGDNLGNGGEGVTIFSGPADNTVGGTMPGAGNTIGFNAFNGVFVGGAGTTGNRVLGNFIGTDAGGNALGNGLDGVRLNFQASANTVGGVDDGAGNIIGFNSENGVQLNGGATANSVLGNLVGTNVAGDDLGNGLDGLVIRGGSTDNTIGGAALGEGNTIGFNRASGIFIGDAGTTGNRVLGNFIGTNAAGDDLRHVRDGIAIGIGASGNTIGGAAPGEGNVIGLSGLSGVLLFVGATGNEILGNFIGTNADGDDLGIVGDGIAITSGSTANTIGGAAPGAGNIIGFNGASGVFVGDAGTTGNRVLGNFIGTNAAGDDLRHVRDGVAIGMGASGNTIGGAATGEGNTIGFNRFGVMLEGAGTTGNALLGNFIGTNAAGDQNLGNVFHGVLVRSGASSNVIGGAGAGNTIGFNGNDGVFIQEAETTDNAVLGNYIGTSANGQNLGNLRFGVVVTSGASDNTIGGVGVGNTIGFNVFDGVLIQSTTGNALAGNFIGTNAVGQNLGNGRHGVTAAAGASDNTIGGAAAGAGNTIGYNAANGVFFVLEATGNRVHGNFIGVSADGSARGNGLDGVRIIGGSSGNLIGGSAPGEGNTIWSNAGAGVLVADQSTAGNAILGNTIFDSGALAIDLSAAGGEAPGDGLTANDGCGDPDTGPNGFQNFPTLLSAVVAGGSTTIEYELETAAGNHRVEFFSVPAADPSGHGEGLTFLSAEQVSVSASCDETFQVVLPLTLAPGELVTATATPLDGAEASGFGGTSEFSAAVNTVGKATQIAINAGDGQGANAGQAVIVAPSVIVRDANGNPVPGVDVTFVVAAGGGSVTGAAAPTNASGIATVGSWTLGPSGGTNTLTATAAGVPESVTFSALGVQVIPIPTLDSRALLMLMLLVLAMAMPSLFRRGGA